MISTLTPNVVAIAGDQSPPQIGFAREIIVDAGLADADFFRNVRIAEGMVAARLYKLACGVQYLLSCVGFFRHAAILPDVKSDCSLF